MISMCCLLLGFQLGIWTIGTTALNVLDVGTSPGLAHQIFQTSSYSTFRQSQIVEIHLGQELTSSRP